MIQAVFWDYDNTILATAEAHWRKHLTVLASYGIVLDEKFRKRIYENNGSQNWEWISAELDLLVPEKEYLRAIDTEFQLHMCRFELRPGVAELFTAIQALKIPQAIITNARKASAQPVLQEKGIIKIMDVILYKEDYEGRKPGPEPYLRGFEKMAQILGYSIEPKRCIAIEDDPKGVESAHRAGAIVIHRKLSNQEQNCPFADYCCFHEAEFVSLMKTLLNS